MSQRERNRNLPAIRLQQGVALLEVLIVFFVLSIGLLGMAALQLKSIQYSQSSYMRSQATVAANDMLDRLRLNGGTAFTDTDTEYVEWAAFVNGTLPTTGGAVPLPVCASNVCAVTINWEDRMEDLDNDADGVDDTTRTLVISSGM